MSKILTLLKIKTTSQVIPRTTTATKPSSKPVLGSFAIDSAPFYFPTPRRRSPAASSAGQIATIRNLDTVNSTTASAPISTPAVTVTTIDTARSQSQPEACPVNSHAASANSTDQHGGGTESDQAQGHEQGQMTMNADGRIPGLHA